MHMALAFPFPKISNYCFCKVFTLAMHKALQCPYPKNCTCLNGYDGAMHMALAFPFPKSTNYLQGFHTGNAPGIAMPLP